MSEKMISPGVFTYENDLSFLPQGIAQIGAAIIGPTAKGPVFIPTLVSSYEEFTNIFGSSDGNSYVPYTVKNYLKNSGRATIVRVANSNTYSSKLLKVTFTPSTGSISGSVLLGAVIADSNNTGSSFSSWSINYSLSGSTDPTVFGLQSGSVYYTCSLNPNSDSYISNVLGKSPSDGRSLYVYETANSEAFTTIIQEFSSNLNWRGSGSLSLATSSIDGTDDIIIAGNYDSPSYTVASSPFIKSQLGNDLFKFHSLGEGTSEVYISIESIKLSGENSGTVYGSFNVLVRKIGDTDLRPVILETFTQCNLDPTSNSYVAKKIGDQYRTVVMSDDGIPKLKVSGDYVTRSKYVRIEMSDAFGPTEVPFGFGKYYSPIVDNPGFTLQHKYLQKSDEYDTGSSATGSFQYKYYYGFNFSDVDNLFVLKPVSDGASEIASSDFSLHNCEMQSGSINSTATMAYTASLAPSKSRKFSVALQGGFDGNNPTIPKYMGQDIISSNTMGFNCATPTSEGTLQYKKAIDLLSNVDEFDINMVVLPGIINDLHPTIVTYANDMVEDRGDAFLLFDCTSISSGIYDAQASIQDIDSNYSATYYPWIKVYDSDTMKYMWVPPSVVMASVIAYNDKVAAPWFAPAGLNRGGISDATAVYTRLSQSEKDFLYENRINPLVSFINQGIVAWGQKTLQVKASAFDRINIRRLLIELKKYIASVTKLLVFEQNNIQTRTRFINTVNPYLEGVQQKQGLYTFKVVMDETTNTPDVIDRNRMVGKIYLQPTRTAEIIEIGFNITNTGASFDA